MRARLVGAILILVFSLPFAAEPVHASASSRFVLSSHDTFNERYRVQLVSINADKTVVIVLERGVLFRAQPGERFCVASGQRCANFRLISADPRHQRAVLQAEQRPHTITDPPKRPNQAMERTATRRAFAFLATSTPVLRATRAFGGRRSSYSR